MSHREFNPQPRAFSFSILGSGSSGNVTFVETGSARILIDAGLSARETARRLESIGRSIEDIDLICISHEHDDHSRGLAILTQKHQIAVAATAGTLRKLRGKLDPNTERVELQAGRSSRFADLDVEPFRIPHDAAEPIGFRLHSGGLSLGHVTDLGMVDKVVLDALGGLNALVAESNHDVEMVRNGPYPLILKQRILNTTGHLSNDALAEALREMAIDNLRVLYLAHLSQTNNRPELARVSAELALADRGKQVAVHVARPDKASPVIAVTGAPTTRNELDLGTLGRRPQQLAIPFDDWQFPSVRT